MRLPRKEKKAFKIFLWEQTVNLKRKYFVKKDILMNWWHTYTDWGNLKNNKKWQKFLYDLYNK